jgi:hypothetical protein
MRSKTLFAHEPSKLMRRVTTVCGDSKRGCPQIPLLILSAFESAKSASSADKPVLF